jgi:hypothetical protein
MSISSPATKSIIVEDNNSSNKSNTDLMPLPGSLVMVEISMNEKFPYLPPKMSAYYSKIEIEHEREVTEVGSSSQACFTSSNPKVANLSNTPANSAAVSTLGSGIPTSTNDVVPLLSTTTNQDDQVEIAKRNQKKSHQRTFLAKNLELARNGDCISQFNLGLI